MSNAALKIEQFEGQLSLLQGNLQTVFDALYQLGVIDPVLEMDWEQAYDSKLLHQDQIEQAIEIANKHQSNVDSLVVQLRKFDERTLGYLAMEVAREYADFHSRKNLH